jgi:hypothetical protein
MHMSRASLFWVINGVIVRCLSDAQLRTLRKGTKQWENGQHSSSTVRPVLGCPVPEHIMRATPMFPSCPGAGPSAQPMRHGVMDAVLRALLRTFMDDQTARRYSWHSFLHRARVRGTSWEHPT